MPSRAPTLVTDIAAAAAARRPPSSSSRPSASSAAKTPLKQSRRRSCPRPRRSAPRPSPPRRLGGSTPSGLASRRRRPRPGEPEGLELVFVRRDVGRLGSHLGAPRLRRRRVQHERRSVLAAPRGSGAHGRMGHLEAREHDPDLGDLAERGRHRPRELALAPARRRSGSRRPEPTEISATPVGTPGRIATDVATPSFQARPARRAPGRRCRRSRSSRRRAAERAGRHRLVAALAALMLREHAAGDGLSRLTAAGRRTRRGRR